MLEGGFGATLWSILACREIKASTCEEEGFTWRRLTLENGGAWLPDTRATKVALDC